MEESAVVVESQPTMDVSRGPLVDITPEQRTEFRKTGELPKAEPKVEPKVEESAPSEENKAVEGDPPPPKTAQERSERDKAKSAKRFNDLLEENKRLKADLEARKPEAAPKPEPKAAADKEPNPEDTNADGTPKYKSYEEFTKAQARWEIRQEIAEQKRIEAEQAQSKAFNEKMAAAEGRYENFAEIADPFAGEILGDKTISPVVKQMFRDSDVMPDLVFTIASDEASRADFLKMAKEDPGKAIRYIALTESLITDQLSKSAKTEVPPVKPKTQAPKPPSEAGGRAAAPPDALEEAAKANDFRRFSAEATRRQLAKLKS